MFGPVWFIWFFILLFAIISDRFDTHTELIRHKRVFVWLWWMLSVAVFGFLAFVLNENMSSASASILVFIFVVIAFLLISVTTYHCRYLKHMHIYVPIIPFIIYVWALIKYVPFNNDIFPISFVGASILFVICYIAAMHGHERDMKILAQEAEEEMIKAAEIKEKMEELKKKGLISEDYDV